MGIENELSETDIKDADVLILATDIAIEGSERFESIRKIQVPVQSVLKDSEAIFSKL